MNNSASPLQCGHATRRVSEGFSRIAPSHDRQVKCIIGVMKPLIVILLLAIAAQAQTLADVARQERARRAQLKSAPVVVLESLPAPAPPSKPGTAEEKPATDKPAPPTAPAAGAPAAAPPAAPATPAPPVPDRVKEYDQQLEKLRRRIEELQDQETALQLQVNQLTNQFFAPVSDQASKDQAQARLGETQNKLTATRQELDQTRRTLNDLQQQGPPPRP